MVGGWFGAHTPFEGLSSPRGAVAFKIFKDLPHRNLKSVPGHTFETFNPTTGANRPTVGGYSTLSRGLARALLARHAVAASKP